CPCKQASLIGSADAGPATGAAEYVTLLEESVAQQSCPAFFLACTLLETLTEHFQGPGNALVGRALRLAEHLPSAVTVDLSSVSLPLRQSLDQVVRWTLPGAWPLSKDLPKGLQLPACVKRFLSHCESGTATFFEGLSVYTDGSFDGNTASWAFCVFGLAYGKLFFLGWAAGRVPTKAGDALSLRAGNASALCGEQHAILWAATWMLQCPSHLRSSILSDCLVALSQATGVYGWSDTEGIAPLCRAAMQAACAARPTLDQSISHVRSHQGCPPNELADVLAKHFNAGGEETPNPHQVWVAQRIREGALEWLWVQIEAAITPEHWPTQVGSSLVDHCRHSDAEPLTASECRRSAATTPPPEEGFTGRARYLREQLQHQGIQVAALQEDTGGNFGCELWFSRTIPFIGGLQVLFVSLHAPVAGSPGRQEWWKSLFERILRFRRGAAVVLAGDYNAGFSTQLSGLVGDLVWPTKHDTPAGLLAILQQCGLWVPSTFSECHSGQHETWVSPSGTSGARLDYFSLPTYWGVAPKSTWIDASIDWGQSRADHYGLVVQTHFQARAAPQCKRKGVRLDREAMCTAEGRVTVAAICHGLPLQPWTSNVHRHYAELERHLTAALSIAFPCQRGNCRTSYFSTATWEMRQKRSWLRRQIAKERNSLRLAEALAALCSLNRALPVNVGRILAFFPIMRSVRRFAALVADMQKAKCSLKHLIRSDIHRRISETAATAAAIPTADVVTRLRPLLGPAKRKAHKQQALQSVCRADGTVAQTPDEAEDLWVKHFAGIEAGVCIDPVVFAREVQATQTGKDLDGYCLTTEDVPSRLELEDSLRRTQTGRAFGLDNVPGEVLHVAAGASSRALYQLFLKMSLRVAEPVQFKGGSLFAIWKGKASTSQCSAYRGILVSSSPGKAFHRTVRGRSVGPLREFGHDMQIGGLPRFPVVMASHFVRLFQEGKHHRRESYGLLFLDLREAFYRVVRPLLVGSACHDEELARVVQAVRLPPEVMHELHRHLSSRSVLAEAGASQWTEACIAEALDGTWFRFQGGERVVRTGIGSRPGDNLADVCFSFIFAKVLKSVQDELRFQRALPEIPWSPLMLGNIFPVETDNVDTIHPLDSTWMDDASFLVEAPSARDLPSVLQIMGRAVIDSCVARALLPNLDKGKTEFVASPVGPGSRVVRAELFSGQEPKLCLGCRLWPSASVRLVPTYQHLGGFIHHDATLSRELRHRVGLAWKAFNDRKKKVFAAPAVGRRDKVVLFESLVLTILLYGAGSWCVLGSRELAILTTAYHSMACHMLRPEFPYERAIHLSRSRVLALLGLPSMPVLFDRKSGPLLRATTLDYYVDSFDRSLRRIRKAPDEGKFQAPSLQVEGPLLPLRGTDWQDFLERPSIEVLDCLGHISFGLDGDSADVPTAWDRARIAFSSVCLPVRKIQATARAWLSILEDNPPGGVFPTVTLQDIARWILTAELAEWLVPQPTGRVSRDNTFQDAQEVLPALQVTGLSPPVPATTGAWTGVRVGSSKWLSSFCPVLGSSIDFTHSECLQAFAEGGLPSFIEDHGLDTVFVVSIGALPTWQDCPQPPVRHKAFNPSLAKALLAGDLLRFVLRLWLLGVPAALCTDRKDAVPSPVCSLPFLHCVEKKGLHPLTDSTPEMSVFPNGEVQHVGGGAAQICGCASSSDDLYDEFCDEAELWADLNGLWYRQKDNHCVGEMFEGSLIWHVQWNLPKEVSNLQVLSPDTITLGIQDEVLLGKVQRHAQTAIHWSDGDVWLRK
ncbi:unnamed protein product, partial [Symbiodinium sp. CCMP2456]